MQSLLNLKKQSIHFGSPRDFNDPYDCAIAAGISAPSPDDLEAIRKHYLATHSPLTKAEREFFESSQQEFTARLVLAASETLDQQRETFLDNRGVSCFSERNDDLRMWAQYGGSYEGFCLEYRTEYEPFTLMRKVNYVKDMPFVDLVALLAGQDYSDVFEKLFCTKSLEWAHEKEWRAFHNEAGTLFTYEAAALKAVYFGPRMEQQAIEIVCLVLAGQNSGVGFWQGTCSRTKFEVEFSPFEYTSFIDAQRDGLK